MLREVAEYPNSFGPLGPHDKRIDTGRYTLWIGTVKKWNTVQRHRFPLEEVDDVIAEVRATLRERGRTETQWEVGSSAPAGLGASVGAEARELEGKVFAPTQKREHSMNLWRRIAFFFRRLFSR